MHWYLNSRSRNGDLGSSKHASTPGLRFRRSEKTPSSNFFMFFTGRPNASNLKTNARTMSVPVMW